MIIGTMMRMMSEFKIEHSCVLKYTHHAGRQHGGSFKKNIFVILGCEQDFRSKDMEFSCDIMFVLCTLCILVHYRMLVGVCVSNFWFTT